MPRFFRHIVLVAVCAWLVARTSAFSLIGPFETWQTAALGYNPLNNDIGGPHNLGEEFRWSVPVLTYGFDDEFLSYFGTNGVKAIDAAMAILNALPAFSTLDGDLSEYPLFDPSTGAQTTWRDARRVNWRAQADGLVDLKSTALGIVLEELGLASPERWTWALRARNTDTATPPNTNYLVINRNFDPGRRADPSKYVNGTRYTYSIESFTLPVAFEDAVEATVDPSDPQFTAVASVTGFLFGTGLSIGTYYDALTRDDIGGLRYLYTTNNVNREQFPANAQVFVPDVNNWTIVTNQDLNAFSSLTLTSPPAVLQALYPSLQITSTNFSFTNRQEIGSIYITNVAQGPWSDPFTVQLEFRTNFVTVPQILYHYTFTNVITNYYTTNTQVRVETFGVQREPWSDPFNPVFSTNVQYVVENVPSGGIIILPANVGGYVFSGFATTNVFETTNIVYLANIVAGGIARQAGHVEYRLFTNVSYIAYPLISIPIGQTTALRPGVDKLKFVKFGDGTLQGQPNGFTNRFEATYYQDGKPQTSVFEVVQTAPNFLFSAADLGIVNNGVSPVRVQRSAAYTPSGVAGALSGIIGPTITIAFNNIGPTFYNQAPGFVNEASFLGTSLFRGFVWGSFDGSTNPPVVYPRDLTLEQIESRALNPASQGPE